MSERGLSVLISARKNSKYLAKFLAGLFVNTSKKSELDIALSINDEDTWNAEIIAVAQLSANMLIGRSIKVIRDSSGYGRAGLHTYFNDLIAGEEIADWTVYFCDDHFINPPEVNPNGKYWDDYLYEIIDSKKLDPDKVYSIIPKFDNVGAMNQILSRGYIKALGGIVGRHGWIDSYLNDVNSRLPAERIIMLDHAIFHDFTHDKPNPLSDDHSARVKVSNWTPPAYKSSDVFRLIDSDAATLKKAIEAEDQEVREG